jgi:hypothetical protein
MKDLAPEIYRQRVVIEGIPKQPLEASEIRAYLSGLSKALGMQTLIEPVSHRSPRYGEAAWIHWESSGAHFYAWDIPKLFFSVDIYTCKPFKLHDALTYTSDFFKVKSLQSKEF